jgi:signal transduction histidine kinase/ligand-binding sensor domain-containing protein
VGAVRGQLLTSRATLIVALACGATAPAPAESLPIRAYGVGDGLPHSRVARIVQDTSGFLWLCTPEGLARFDGTRFLIYGQEDGLPSDDVNHFLEARDGTRWVATGAGIARMRRERLITPEGGPGELFEPVSFELREGEGRLDALVLHQDAAGAIWAGSGRGLWRLDGEDSPSIFRRVTLPNGAGTSSPGIVRDLKDAAGGGLWIAATSGLYRRSADGATERFILITSEAESEVRAILPDAEGRIWIGHDEGLVIFAPPAAPAGGGHGGPVILRPRLVVLDGQESSVPLPRKAGEALWYSLGETVTHNVLRRIVRGADDRIWLAQIGRGLVAFESGRFRRWTKGNGLSDDSLSDVAEDGAGNLWLASDAGGAMRLSWSGFTSFGTPDGLGHSYITSIFEDPAGRLWVSGGNLRMSRLAGERFESAGLPLPPGVSDPYFFSEGILDSEGSLWAPTSRGLFRFPPVADVGGIARLRPERIFDETDGIPGRVSSLLFEDREGDIWMAIAEPTEIPLVRWERSMGRFHSYGADEGLPSGLWVTAIGQSPAGRIWIAFEDGRLGRLAGRAFELPGPGGGLPRGWINDLHFDDSGRLWIASSREGVALVEDPQADVLSLRRYRRGDGLSSDRARAVVSDLDGIIYVGTTRGVDRLDPATGAVRHLGAADGLANEEVNAACRDRAGDLWFGTLDGLSRLSPGGDKALPAPRIRIAEISIDGESLPVHELGALEVLGVEAPPGSILVRIGYFGIPLDSSEPVLYEYRLGGGSAEWEPPTSERSVTFARLSPGSYRFEVRAAGGAGSGDPEVAAASFVILPPFYRTAWFQALVMAVIAAAAWAVHRNRVAKAVEVERLRHRIATDLHDDVGSNLSQIAILSELVKRKIGGSDAVVGGHLARIAGVSRETVDTMSDIVWAINPARDRLSDLVHRVRRFGNDLMGAREIRFSMAAPEAPEEIRLDSETRRQLFLVAKEGLNNAARHSGATRVDLLVELREGWLILEITDDGRGFDPSIPGEGHGLAGMRSRAAEMGGAIHVQAGEGSGTRIRMSVPMRRPRE